MTAPPTVIVVYSIDYSDGLLRELPYVRYFYERGLSQLARLTAPDARVVIVTPEPVERSILDYHYRDVLGFTGAAEQSARNRSVFLSPEPRETSSLAQLVLDDERLMSTLRDECDTTDNVLLVNFAASAGVERLGAALGIAVEEGPYRSAVYWGSKSGSKAAFAKGGVPAPLSSPGVLRSPDEVAAAVRDLADAPSRRRNQCSSSAAGVSVRT
jgi:hypothetical protein